MTSAATDTEPRAGVWRRWLSSVIDVAIVGAPFQIVVAILFAMTAGFVQVSNSGFVVNVCHPRTSIPAGLTPSPPHDSNFATDCSHSFFGAQTGRSLIVGRSEKQGQITKNVFRTYMLDKDGNPINGVSIDGYVLLVLIAYFVVLTTTSGRTLGDRCVRIRVVDAANPARTRVPLRGTILRYLAMLIGYIPIFALLVAAAWRGGGDPEALADGATAIWLLLAGAVALVWTVTLVIQIARKSDPLYDRLGGTAVIRA